jgi:outer membrane receptor for ferrienterochelin and colicin
VGGMMGYERGMEQVNPNPWGYTSKMQRIEEWAKFGKVFDNREATSVGLQLSSVYHDQASVYGVNSYSATQHSYYANLIFQTYINNTNHIIKAGSSLVYDQYNENETYADLQNYARTEVVPGVFTEYAYNYSDKFNLVAGLRADYDNLYGAFLTPRLHARYALAKNTILRASVGRAQHTANIFAENMGLMASNKHFLIETDQTGKAYGLDPEVAWNTGINLLQKFKLDYREGSISMDYYYTNFQNQVVVDEEYPRFVRFYNLKGVSYAHSFQIQLDHELLHHLDIRIAYRYYNVMTTYEDSSKLKEKPLIPAHRAFINLDYEAPKGWKFTYTIQWIGEKRLFAADSSHHGYYTRFSPAYYQMNAQITKMVNDKLDLYLGGENLTNYMQHGDIIKASAPFSSDFDASQIWGPIMGINIYVGIRYKLK